MDPLRMSFTLQPEKDGTSAMQILRCPQFLSCICRWIYQTKINFTFQDFPVMFQVHGFLTPYALGGTRTRSTSTRPNRSTWATRWMAKVEQPCRLVIGVARVLAGWDELPEETEWNHGSRTLTHRWTIVLLVFGLAKHQGEVLDSPVSETHNIYIYIYYWRIWSSVH